MVPTSEAGRMLGRRKDERMDHIITFDTSNDEAKRIDAVVFLTAKFGSDPRFTRVLVEALELHGRKQQDYGADHDPFANIRATEHYGIPAWVGAEIRGADKSHRLAKAVRQVMAGQAVSMANESVEDSLIDRLVYTAIELVLYREWFATEKVVALTAQETDEPSSKYPAHHALYGAIETTR